MKHAISLTSFHHSDETRDQSVTSFHHSDETRDRSVTSFHHSDETATVLCNVDSRQESLSAFCERSHWYLFNRKRQKLLNLATGSTLVLFYLFVTCSFSNCNVEIVLFMFSPEQNDQLSTFKHCPNFEC